jgi:hypothetical protein
VELLVGELSSLVEEHFLCLGWNLRVSVTFLFSRQAGNDVKVQVVHADIRVVERAYRVDEVSQRSTSAFQGCAFACEFRKIRMRSENFAKFRIRIASQRPFWIRIIFAKCEEKFQMRKIRKMRIFAKCELFACEFSQNANLCEMRIFAKCEFVACFQYTAELLSTQITEKLF